jgi:molybdenum cofactor cytidylyltransferase
VISGVVLAAGSSARLGEPKQLLDLDGRPALQHVVDAAAASALDEIVVVLGHRAEEIAAALELPATARIVVNPDHAAGQSTSLIVGLDALDEPVEAAVILLGDQPRMTVEAIDAVIEAHERTGAAIVRPSWQGTPGHPVLVARSGWDRFRAAEGDRGAGPLIAAAPDVHEIEMGAPPPIDIDTWDDYKRIS